MKEKVYFQSLKRIRGGFAVEESSFNTNNVFYNKDVFIMIPKKSTKDEKLVCIKHEGKHRLLFGFVNIKGGDPLYINTSGHVEDRFTNLNLQDVIEEMLANSNFEATKLPIVEIYNKAKKQPK